MSSSRCEVKESIELLKSLTENIVSSPCFSKNVIDSSKYIVKHIKNVIVKNISSAIIQENFFPNTEAYQYALEVYNYDRKIFSEVFDNVFKQISNDENGKRIFNSLKEFQDPGAAVDAYCALFKYINYIQEYLCAFQNAVSNLLKQPNLSPQVIDKLKELKINIEKKSDEHLRYQVISQQLTDLWD